MPANADTTRDQSYETWFRLAPLGMFLSSSDDVIVDANDAAVCLLGFTREELLGKTSVALGFLTAAGREQALAALRKDGHVRDLELRLTVKSGAHRDVSCGSSASSLELGPSF